MVRALWSAASGMIGQQKNIDVISNNLANVNTQGFKRSRVDFEDLIYQTERVAGTPSGLDTTRPLASQFGHGVRVAATQRIFEQGAIQQTGNDSDLAIVGENAYFAIIMPDESISYTRSGNFLIDANGHFTTSQGYRLYPEIIVPMNIDKASLTVSGTGIVTGALANSGETVDLGQINLFRFANPQGLSAIGSNLYKISEASGDAQEFLPGNPLEGSLEHRFLESSNVSVASEMINMIVAQRAYELGSKAIQTSDSMLSYAINLKRT